VSIVDALPVYHHGERHSIRIAASPERALAAAHEASLEDVPLVRALFRLRGLRASPRGPIWDALLAEGFQAFGADTVVLVGRPWAPGAGRRSVEDFVAFDDPGWAKIAMELRAVPAGDGARLETETRVFLTDPGSRRRFGAYWVVIRPFSGFVRRSWLRAAKRRAEA
jgi:hypothetical protein